MPTSGVFLKLVPGVERASAAGDETSRRDADLRRMRRVVRAAPRIPRAPRLPTIAAVASENQRRTSRRGTLLAVACGVVVGLAVAAALGFW